MDNLTASMVGSFLVGESNLNIRLLGYVLFVGVWVFQKCETECVSG
jgi:hypothetical protein